MPSSTMTNIDKQQHAMPDVKAIENVTAVHICADVQMCTAMRGSMPAMTDVIERDCRRDPITSASPAFIVTAAIAARWSRHEDISAPSGGCQCI
jgi:hypothetical protein